MVASSPALTEVREFLTAHGAGFMRNTKHVLGETCTRCTGMVKPGYVECYPCSFTYPGNGADRLGFLAYAWHPAQSGAVMRGYKAPTPTPTAVNTVQAMLSYGVVAHLECMVVPDVGGPTSWVSVPSLPARDGSHQLERLAAPIFTNQWGHPGLYAAAEPVDPRGFHPDNFVVPDGANGHVLLIDDTWAKGGHIESAAAALKAAGATYVTALLVARWITPGWMNTDTFISTHLTADYDPDICPFTGVHC